MNLRKNVSIMYLEKERIPPSQRGPPNMGRETKTPGEVVTTTTVLYKRPMGETYFYRYRFYHCRQSHVRSFLCQMELEALLREGTYHGRRPPKLAYQ